MKRMEMRPQPGDDGCWLNLVTVVIAIAIGVLVFNELWGGMR